MLISLLALALSTAQPAPVFADYVLNVPLRIENMQNVTGATLSCLIYHYGTEATDRQDLTTPGTGNVNVPLTNGAYSGTMSVTVGVSAANALRYTPNTYLCFLSYTWRNPDGTTFTASLSAAERAAAYTQITGQQITENTTSITGPIPPG